MHAAEDDDDLIEALGVSQRLGFLGERPVVEVIEHARLFVESLGTVTGRVLDLGSGGGVPGLVVAHDRPDLEVTLLDRRTKRTDFLERTVRRLGWAGRVHVVAADVDDAVRSGHIGFDAVTARGFGPPDVTLRAARRCLRDGGRVVISDPPSADDRWPTALLDEVGVSREPNVGTVANFLIIGVSAP